MKTANGNGTNNNADRIHRIVPETANENARGVSVLRDIAATLADHIFAGERISSRVRYPQPLAALAPPDQAYDSTTRGFLQAIAADPWA
jgi:hypothetical protein